MRVLAQVLQVFVVGVIPERVGKETFLERDAMDAIALLGDVAFRHQASSHASWSRFGNVILHSPASNCSMRAIPFPSNVPSSTVPSGRVTRYFSPGTGLSSSPTNSTSIHVVVRAAVSSAARAHSSQNGVPSAAAALSTWAAGLGARADELTGAGSGGVGAGGGSVF